MLAGAWFAGRGGRVMLGIAGMIVVTEAVERWALFVDWVGCARGGAGMAADEGVVG